MKTSLKTVQKHLGKTVDAGFNNKEPVFYGYGIAYQAAHDTMHIEHTGWHTNDDGTTYKDGSGKAWGAVATLPAMPGFSEGRFLAGYHWGDNGETVLWPELYSDKKDAADRADEHARVFADNAREDNAKFNAARDLETDIEDGLTRLRECIALRHKACMDYVRDEIVELCEAIRDKRETLRTEYADYV